MKELKVIKRFYTAPNYERKSVVMPTYDNLVQFYKLYSKLYYLRDHCECDDVVESASEELKKCSRALFGDIDNMTEEEKRELARIGNAYFQRSRRLRQRVGDMLSKGPCIFLTLTFTDKILNNSTEEERRLMVIRYLKSVCSVYVANKDFGAKNGREHYHALILSNKIDYKGWHNIGALKGEKVRCSSKSVVCVSKYIAKLSNHAIKETAAKCSLVYSRNAIGGA